VRELTGIKGIGRKTAERMIIELKDPVQLGGGAAAPGAPAAPRAVEEAVLALTALGIASLAARQAVQRVIEKEGAELSVQQLIRRALQER
jgi:Holliday junction DNA helicase RuvA